MRVGILDILALPTKQPAEVVFRVLLTKQYASVTPQAISVWCRQLGHEAAYGTYYGVGDPCETLPPDLDILFISCHTQASALAYALSKKYRMDGTRTVLGGPHAKAFPIDCLRFFDLVVLECDKNLIADILRSQFDPGSIISSARPFSHLPSVEERMPEIRASALLWRRRRYLTTCVPLLASIGCPYKCEFCIDYDNEYRLLPLDLVASDLRYLSENMPGTLVSFHDPNFAVRFDPVLKLLESRPPELRLPYVMESSLSNLRGARVQRLEDTNCAAVVTGIESWNDYSQKAAQSGERGMGKVDKVVEHFSLLHDHIPYLQANFIFGLDSDKGDEPVDLTKEFMRRAPFAWPTINIPVPFGGTPLFERWRSENRLLESMPFSFYYAPYTVFIPKNYDAGSYYEKLVALFAHSASLETLRARLRSTPTLAIKMIHCSRTVSTRVRNHTYRRILKKLRSEQKFRAFHEGRLDTLPDFYHHEYERMLGPYAELMSRADRKPILDHVAPNVSDAGAVSVATVKDAVSSI
ncbi:MAG: radical SAM protein [Planctomycetota bacterium]|nr:radical SAM protein [Planctomycetota bacterium]